MKFPISHLLLILWLAGAAGCGTNVGNALVQVELTDAPADYEEVHVTLGAIEALYRNPDGDTRWIVLVEDGGTHDLLKLRDGVTAVLGKTEMPEGDYQELRMIVQSATVTVGGETHPLTIPSGAETGIKIPYPFLLDDGKTYVMVIDFDAEASVKRLGMADEYLLEPVIGVQSFSEQPSIPKQGGTP